MALFLLKLAGFDLIQIPWVGIAAEVFTAVVLLPGAILTITRWVVAAALCFLTRAPMKGIFLAIGTVLFLISKAIVIMLTLKKLH